MQARRVHVLGGQEHRLLRRACSDVAAVLAHEVARAAVQAEVEAQGTYLVPYRTTTVPLRNERLTFFCTHTFVCSFTRTFCA